MSNDSEKGNKTWKQIGVLIIQGLFYPVHFVFRFITQSAILAAVFIPLLILILILIAEAWNIDLSKLREEFIADKLLFTIITLLASVGLFSFLVQKFIETIRKSLSNIKKKTIKIAEVFWNTELPRTGIRKSLLETFCSVAKVWPFMIKVFTEYINLILSVLMLCITFFLGYVSTKDVQEEVQKKVQEKVPPQFMKPIRDTISISGIWKDSVMEKLDSIERDIERLSLRPSTSYLFEKGTRFSLAYLDTGDLKSKTGIWPEGKDLKWLELFKKAISECSEEKRMELKIQAFASVTPVIVNGILTYTQSNQSNCEIANQRAEALIYYLTTEKYDSTECKNVLNDDRRWGRLEGKLCARERPDILAWKGSDFTVTYDDSPRVQWEGPLFTVTYEPWKSYDEMATAKPADDGPPRDPPRPGLEFLNRTVQIIIEEGGDCWSESFGNTGPN